MAVKTPAVSNANNTNINWLAAIAGSNTRIWHPSNMIAGWSIVERYVLECSAGGALSSNTNITPIVGTRVAVGMPPNTSVVAAKTVVPIGRQYRGRMLLPPTYVASANIDSDGIILAASVTALQGFMNVMWSTLNSAGFPPVLLHQPPQGGGIIPPPTLISGFTVNQRIGTIRHRIRR